MKVLGFEWREVWFGWILKLRVLERNSVENVDIDNVVVCGWSCRFMD